jgi:hypothetical protein
MALGTMGTTAQTSLTSRVFANAMPAADIAGIANIIKDDLNNLHPIWPGAWAQTGLLYVPNRGVLRMLPGDYVAVDPATGWPIMVSARAAAQNPQWVHT